VISLHNYAVETLAHKPPEPSGIPAAAAVLLGYDFKEMSVFLPEVDAAPAVVVVDLALLGLSGIGPLG
jgi:hypothetical protein